MRRNLLNRT